MSTGRGILCRILLAPLLALLLMMTLQERADARNEVVRKPCSFRKADGTLEATVGFRELFDQRLKRRLKSGFPTTVVMRVYLYAKESGAPISLAARTLKAYFDPWDEHYLLVSKDHRGAHARQFKNQKDVVDRLTSLWRFPVARLDQLKKGSEFFVAVIAEVNPVDRRLLQEVRLWLRNPHGAHRQMGGESFFGSFVSIFVNNKIRRAEKTLRVRTKPVRYR